MDWLEFTTLVVPGLSASLDFSSLLFLHFGCRELSDPDKVRIEQLYLRIFESAGFALNAFAILCLLFYALRFSENNAANDAIWSALFFFAVAAAVSIWLTRFTKQEIRGWNPEKLPENWKSIRASRAIAQGVRASVQLAGFFLISGSVASR